MLHKIPKQGHSREPATEEMTTTAVMAATAGKTTKATANSDEDSKSRDASKSMYSNSREYWQEYCKEQRQQHHGDYISMKATAVEIPTTFRMSRMVEIPAKAGLLCISKNARNSNKANDSHNASNSRDTSNRRKAGNIRAAGLKNSTDNRNIRHQQQHSKSFVKIAHFRPASG
jgi:hypothetical protein